MVAADRGDGARGRAVVLMLLVPAVTPFLVEIVRRVAGHRASVGTWAALGFCVLLVGVGLTGLLGTLSSGRRAGVDPAPIRGVFGVFCLVFAIIDAIDGATSTAAGFVDPVDMRSSAALLGGLGLAVLVGDALHDRRRRASPEPEEGAGSAPAAPAGGAGWRDTDRGRWVGAAVGAVVAVLLLCAPRSGVVPQLHACLTGAPTAPLWAFVVDAATTVAWIAGTVAFLRAPPEVTSGTDPHDRLDAAERRALDEAVRAGRGVEPELRPRLRAVLVRDLHQRRRAAWIVAALALQALDEGVDDLAHHAAVHPVGTMRIVVGVLGLVVLPEALCERRRVARRLAAVDRAE